MSLGISSHFWFTILYAIYCPKVGCYAYVNDTQILRCSLDSLLGTNMLMFITIYNILCQARNRDEIYVAWLNAPLKDIWKLSLQIIKWNN